jgi:DNA-directed RNA polymerase III subunit RPC4
MFYKEESDDDDDDGSDNVELQETQPDSIECEALTRPAEELDLLV